MRYLPILLLLAACVATDPVILKHPKTGQTVQCGPYSGRGEGPGAAVMHEIQCIQDFKEQGFIRVPG